MSTTGQSNLIIEGLHIHSIVTQFVHQKSQPSKPSFILNHHGIRASSLHHHIPYHQPSKTPSQSNSASPPNPPPVPDDRLRPETLPSTGQPFWVVLFEHHVNWSILFRCVTFTGMYGDFPTMVGGTFSQTRLTTRYKNINPPNRPNATAIRNVLAEQNMLPA